MFLKLSSLKSIRLSRRWFFLFVVFAMAFVFFQVADEVFEQDFEDLERIRSLDSWILSGVAQLRKPLLTQSMIDITALGSASILTLLTLLIGSWMAALKDKTGLSHLVVALGSSALLASGLKTLFARQRPDVTEHLVHVNSLSFPSGHSFGAAVAYSTFAILCMRHLDRKAHEVFIFILGGIIIGLVGFSRVYLGVHYATDVLGGISAGLAWSFLIAAGFSRLHWPRSR